MELGLTNSNFCTESLSKLFLTKHWNFTIVLLWKREDYEGKITWWLTFF